MSTATVSRVINGQRHSSRKSLRHRRNAGGADEHARARLRPLRVLRWTGVDDIPMARFVTPPLTTVRVRMAELGARALEGLAAAIEAPDATPASTETVPAELVVRESCGAQRAPAPGRRPARSRGAT